MSVSDGESEYSCEEHMKDCLPESNMELEDQNEDESRSRSPIKRPKYIPQ